MHCRDPVPCQWAVSAVLLSAAKRVSTGSALPLRSVATLVIDETRPTMFPLPPIFDIPTASDEISDTQHRFSTLLYIFAPILPTSRLTWLGRFYHQSRLAATFHANGSVLSDGTYVEEGTPEPDDSEAWLSWSRKHNKEDWYLAVAVRNARRKKEERERIEDEKVEAILSPSAAIFSHLFTRICLFYTSFREDLFSQCPQGKGFTNVTLLSINIALLLYQCRSFIILYQCRPPLY